MVKKSWATLPKTTVVEGTRRLMGDFSSCRVSPLQVIKCGDRATLLSLFHRLIGRMGDINPFLSEAELDGEESEDQVLATDCGRSDCEDLLQKILRNRTNAVKACVTLLKAMNLTMLSKAKRLIAASLENQVENAIWQSWTPYVGAELETMTELEQHAAEKAMSKWWNFMSKMYDRLAAGMLESCDRTEQETDVELGLREWRNLTNMIRQATDYDDVFLRERLIFTGYGLGQIGGMSWEKRREALLKLITRKELNLESILDLKRVELSIAEDYDEWMSYAKVIFTLADRKGLHIAGEKELHDNKPLQLRPQIVPKVEQPYKPKTTNPDSCHRCGQVGHWANRCPNGKLTPGFASIRKPNVNAADFTTHIAKSNPTTSLIPKSSAPVQGPGGLEQDKKPYYRTASGRNVYKPKSMCTQSEVIEGLRQHENDGYQDEESRVVEYQVLRTANSNSLEREVPTDREMSMPFVDVIVEGLESPMSGLLDTASNLNYVSRELFDTIKDSIEPCLIDSPTLSIQTMTSSRVIKATRVMLKAAVKDSMNEISIFRLVPFMVYEGQKIPGGSQVLLSADWVTELDLTIHAKDDNYYVLLPKSTEMEDKATQVTPDTEDTPQCLLAVTVDGPDVDDHSYDFKQSISEMTMIMDETIRMGPLNEAELTSIKKCISDPELELCFKPGQNQPPVRELGFPAPWTKQEKLYEVIHTLEERGILEEVPRGSGIGYSPGFGVKKSGDRVRLVIRYVSLNDRLQLPRGLRYHDASDFRESLPSFGSYYVVLDVKDAFYRIRVSKDSQAYLHMSVYHPDGYKEFRWKRAPQGLSCSPAYWAQLIDSTVDSLKRFLMKSDNLEFRSLLTQCAIVVYADDILIAAEHPGPAKLLGRLLRQVLMFNEMFVPLEKMQEGYEVEINGLKLKGGQYFPKDCLVEKVRNLRKPKDKDELRSALGLMNYVRWASPLRVDIHNESVNTLFDMVHSKRKFSWSQQMEDAWKVFVEGFQPLPLDSFSLIPGGEQVECFSLVIQTDASLSGIGFSTLILPRLPDSVYDNLSSFHLGDYADVMRIINVGTRRLSSAETMYLAHDREGLAIHFALMENKKAILLFGQVILQSDSSTALSRYTGNERPKDILISSSTNRGRRWLSWIQDLSDIIGTVYWTHVQGSDNGLADYLSRYAMDDLCFVNQASQTDNVNTKELERGSSQVEALVLATNENDHNEDTDMVSAMSETPALSAISANPETYRDTGLETPEILGLLADWSTDDSSLYMGNLKLQDIYRVLKGDYDGITGKILKKLKEVCKRRFSLFDNGYGAVLLFHNRAEPVTVVPNVRMSDGFPLRTFLVKYIHESSPLAAHRGRDSCMSVLRRVLWYPRMDQDVKAWVASCLPCTIVKSQGVNGNFHPRKLRYVNELIVCDWAGPLPETPDGMRFCFIVVDGFSGFSFTYPTKNKTAKDAVEGILQYSALFGFPEKFSGDNDPSFCSKIQEAFRLALNLKNIQVPSYSPSTSGAAEAAVKRLKTAIACFAEQNDGVEIEWTVLLKGITYCANATDRYGTNYSPFEVMLGRPPVEPLSIVIGGSRERLQNFESEGEYVENLMLKLSEISAYWSSKTMEAKNKASDLLAEWHSELKPGDNCVRISYVSGRRKVLGRVKILRKVEGSSDLYEVYSVATQKPELAHGYQLIQEVFHPDRRAPAPVIEEDQEPLYIISKVLEYHPRRGYFVHWKGCPVSQRTWQLAKDMPRGNISLDREMRKARENYHASRP